MRSPWPKPGATWAAILNAMARLPGLAEWIRVRDWRVGQIDKMSNVTVYRESELTADHVREFGFEHVIVADRFKLAARRRWRAQLPADPGPRP